MNQQIEIWADHRAMRRKVDAVQYDSGRVLECLVQDITIPGDSTARFLAQKPSGALIYNTAKVDGNTVTVSLTSQTLAEAGTVNCQIEIKDGASKSVTSFEFDIEVQRSLVSDAAIESQDEMDVLDQYLADAKAAKDAAKKSEENASNSEAAAKSAAAEAEESKTAAAGSAAKAETAQKAAGESQTKAAASATDAQSWANKSQSWAVGIGDESRQNQATDNSKYYSQEAAKSKTAAAASQQSAADSLAAVQGIVDKLEEIAGGNVVTEEEADAKYVPKTHKVTLTGDVTGTATMEGAETSIATQRRGCIVGNEGVISDNKTWNKFASVTTSAHSDDKNIIFLVAENYSGNITNMVGILIASLRTNNAGTDLAVFYQGLVWVVASSAINPDNYVIASKVEGGKVYVDLWAKEGKDYSLIRFAVLSEGTRFALKSGTWTLYSQNNSANAYTAIPDGYTQTKSTVGNLINMAKAKTNWDVTIAATAWTDATGEAAWSGITPAYKAEAACTGMTADTDITGIQFISGDRSSAATWSYLRPDTNKVILFAIEKPFEQFTLRLTEVK